jgi:hypothetical protein
MVHILLPDNKSYFLMDDNIFKKIYARSKTIQNMLSDFNSESGTRFPADLKIDLKMDSIFDTKKFTDYIVFLLERHRINYFFDDITRLDSTFRIAVFLEDSEAITDLKALIDFKIDESIYYGNFANFKTCMEFWNSYFDDDQINRIFNNIYSPKIMNYQPKILMMEYMTLHYQNKIKKDIVNNIYKLAYYKFDNIIINHIVTYYKHHLPSDVINFFESNDAHDSLAAYCNYYGNKSDNATYKSQEWTNNMAQRFATMTL